MSREIKFRALIKKYKMIVDVRRINFDVKTIEFILSDEDMDLYEARFDEIELMQYTGLRDKNGKEVYEGDIVLDWENEKAVVVWEVTGYRLKYMHMPEDLQNFEEFIEDLVVIGNIWEDKQ